MIKKLKTFLILVLFAIAAIGLLYVTTTVDSNITSKPKMQTVMVEQTAGEQIIEYFGAAEYVEKYKKFIDEYAPLPETYREITSEGTDYDDNPPVQFNEETPAEIVPSNYPSLVVDSSPEIDNADYSWIMSMVKSEMYPDITTHVKEAFTNDGIIRETEWAEILRRSVDWNEEADAGEKDELRKMVQ